VYNRVEKVLRCLLRLLVLVGVGVVVLVVVVFRLTLYIVREVFYYEYSERVYPFF
jgi:hypothetical protein